LRLLKNRCLIGVQSRADFHCPLLSRYTKKDPRRIVNCSALTTRPAVELCKLSLSLNYCLSSVISCAIYADTALFSAHLNSAGVCRKGSLSECPQGPSQEKETKTMGNGDRSSIAMVFVSSSEHKSYSLAPSLGLVED
jgi:hypothetical protein